LDVDKAISRPKLTEIAAAIHSVAGVQAVNITVTEIDLETVGMDVTIQGERIDYEPVVLAIEAAGAVVHSIDELSTGEYLLEKVQRSR
jgi:hypothetical protein